MAKDEFIEKVRDEEEGDLTELILPLQITIMRALRICLKQPCEAEGVKATIKTLFKRLASPFLYIAGYQSFEMLKVFFVFFQMTKTKFDLESEDSEEESK